MIKLEISVVKQSSVRGILADQIIINLSEASASGLREVLYSFAPIRSGLDALKRPGAIVRLRGVNSGKIERRFYTIRTEINPEQKVAMELFIDNWTSTFNENFNISCCRFVKQISKMAKLTLPATNSKATASSLIRSIKSSNCN